MTRITSAIFSVYIATLLYTTIPYVETLTKVGADTPAFFWNHIAIFVIFFCLAFFVLGRHISSFAGNTQIFLGIILVLGLILVILYRVIPIEPIYKLPEMLTPYFATDLAYTAWFLAPLAVLFF